MKELVNKSIYILREAISEFKKPAVLWSTGKDSTTMLALIRKAFNGIPFPVIHIDTSFKFPEIYKFRDKLAKEWEFDLLVAKNEKALSKGMSPKKFTKFKCCTALKTEALKQVLRKHKFDALIVSIRRDEHYTRNIERTFSPRDENFRWHVMRPKRTKSGDSPFISEQQPELWDLFQTDFGPKCSHVRVHPILHWTELDVWKFIREEKLPINPLYFRGYRSLGCRPCTRPTMPKAEIVNDIIKNLRRTNKKERDGREQDKEDALRTLRSLGYM